MSHRPHLSGTRQETAEALALEVLGWLAGDGDRMGAFLAASGLTPAALSRGAGEAQVLAGVLDHMMADDALLRTCAADLGIAPHEFAPARALLPGGELPHWT